MGESRKGYQRTKSGRYRRQLRHPVTGQRLSITADTLGELELKCSRVRQVKAELAIGAVDKAGAIAKLRPLSEGPQTVRALWEQYYKGVSPRSADVLASTWRARLEPYFGDLHPAQLTQDRMRFWLARMQRDRFAPKTVRGAYQALRGAYALAVELKQIDDLPWGKWLPPRARRLREPTCARTIDEVVALLQAARAFDEQRWKRGRYSDASYICLLGVLTGMRHGELAALAWDCIEIDRVPGFVHILYQAKRGWLSRFPDGRPKDQVKTEADSQQLHAGAVEAMRAQREQLQRFGCYRLDGPVFPADMRGRYSVNGKVMKPETIRQIARAASLPRWDAWNIHSLRHTFCTLEAIGSGGDLRHAQKRTRHADIRVLEGYIHAARAGGESSIPELPLSARPAITLPEALEPKLLETARAPALPSREVKAERSKAERRKPVDAAAREWVADGKPAALPAAAKRSFATAYSRAWQRARSAGLELEECRKAGRRARRAAQGAWAQAVRRAELALPEAGAKTG